MARIKNDIFKLSGSMGGITFTQDENGTIARKKSDGPVKLSKGTRESNIEYGAASSATKALRKALNSKEQLIKSHSIVLYNPMLCFAARSTILAFIMLKLSTQNMENIKLIL